MTKEVIGAQFKVINPLDRLVVSEYRKMNLPFAIAEWTSLITGTDDLNLFKNFISTYDKYSTDGLVVDGAYGPRVSNGQQIQKVIEMLSGDPESRRAVITIYNGSMDLNGVGGKNTPCTMSLQFFIRDEKLDLMVSMRSSDVIWGVTYDVFQFTMLQEFVARSLKVDLGSFYFRAGSMHIYDHDWHFFEVKDTRRWPYLMNEMPKLDFEDIIAFENFLMTLTNDSKMAFYSMSKAAILPTYLFDLFCVCLAFMIRKTDKDLAQSIMSSIPDIALRKVMKKWI